MRYALGLLILVAVGAAADNDLVDAGPGPADYESLTGYPLHHHQPVHHDASEPGLRHHIVRYQRPDQAESAMVWMVLEADPKAQATTEISPDDLITLLTRPLVDQGYLLLSGERPGLTLLQRPSAGGPSAAVLAQGNRSVLIGVDREFVATASLEGPLDKLTNLVLPSPLLSNLSSDLVDASIIFDRADWQRMTGFPTAPGEGLRTLEDDYGLGGYQIRYREAANDGSFSLHWLVLVSNDPNLDMHRALDALATQLVADREVEEVAALDAWNDRTRAMRVAATAEKDGIDLVVTGRSGVLVAMTAGPLGLGTPDQVRKHLGRWIDAWVALKDQLLAAAPPVGPSQIIEASLSRAKAARVALERIAENGAWNSETDYLFTMGRYFDVILRQGSKVVIEYDAPAVGLDGVLRFAREGGDGWRCILIDLPREKFPADCVDAP